MTSVTRQSLRFKCSIKDCPWPQDENIHVPWCLAIPDVEHWADKPTHQHHPKKGMGGNNPKSKIVAILCPTCHDRIDNSDWGNDVKEIPGRGRVYFAWDLHNNTLIERVVGLSDGAEAATSGSTSNTVEGVKVIADPTPPRGSEGAVKPESVATYTSAPSLSLKEESDGRDNRECEGDSERGTDRDGIPDISNVRDRPAKDMAAEVGDVSPGGNLGHGRSNTATSLTHEQRVAIAKEIKDTEWNRQWIAGDTANAWRAELGEEAEQYIDDFGYVQESIANIMRVCEAIPPKFRQPGLRFSHHVVVVGMGNLEDMDEALLECDREGWSVAEFRRQVKGTKPKVKRWTLEELLKLAKEWVEADDGDDNDDTYAFLDWLGEQG